ncbi:MAG: cytochrome P450 [Chloroflexi bacterium]|nr:cytochrome P450 [Chloroflexota bacterium]MCY3697924.1 cytochrome P450 [Chloroflexota bacterium]MXX31972.1 cytochrome P450 [Chloroflexota bacterium]MYB22181.1 cytochrome P450 [Chloroflexota bacterium]MYD17112.1 cytochrome P450 [Chloroflexota bacterium]
MVTAERPALTLDTLNITDTSLYVDYGYPWEAWDILRREAPVYWYQRPNFEPFWAITKHADIRYISSHPELFSNTQILRMNDTESIGIGERGREINANRYGGHPSDPPDFIFMDPPEHRQHRSLVAHHFTPRMMKKLEDHFADMADNYVSDFADSMVADFAERGSRSAVDVVHELTAKLPVAAICDMGGVPEEDWDQIFHWTETSAGAADPEFRLPGEDREQTIRRVNLEFNLYNEGMVRDRQANGLGDDLLSDLLRADIDGYKLTPREISSYFRLLLGAGNETTRNSITGGVKALIDHPDQLEDLVANPELVPSAVEEILRWTSIVIQFQRTVTEDLELRGKTLRKGDSIVMWYPSANRDEEVFPDPYRFDIHRDPNDHFAFGGYGEHFCLGANLARWEMRAIFHALLPILPNLELAGEPQMVPNSLHVGGIKRQLVRYRAQ